MYRNVRIAFQLTLFIGLVLFIFACTTDYLHINVSQFTTDDDLSQAEYGQPKKSIIILAYQRTGSTFLGSLFNFDPRVFYVFEPLDALYSSLYGTEPGWNVPSDIVSYSNGTERPVPEADLTAVAEYLVNLLSCHIDLLPTEFLVHTYWVGWKDAMHSSLPFAKCLASINAVPQSENWFLSSYCGQRYGDRRPDRMSECRRLLTSDNAAQRENVTRPAAVDAFAGYRNRMELQLRPLVDHHCSSLLKSACSTKSISVVKLVRGTMRSMEKVLQKLENSYVVHLVRDPRAVSASRRAYHESGRSQYTESTAYQWERTIREASIYCRQVVDDVRWRRRLEQQFPGRLYSLTHEELVDDPVGVATNIYRFVGLTVMPTVLEKYQNLSRNNKRSAGGGNGRRPKWTNAAITQLEFDQITRHGCREMIEFYPQYANVTHVTFRTDYRPTQRVIPPQHWLPWLRFHRRTVIWTT